MAWRRVHAPLSFVSRSSEVIDLGTESSRASIMPSTASSAAEGGSSAPIARPRSRGWIHLRSCCLSFVTTGGDELEVLHVIVGM